MTFEPDVEVPLSALLDHLQVLVLCGLPAAFMQQQAPAAL